MREILLEKRDDGFLARLRRWDGVIALFVAVASLGWSARDSVAGMLGKKADAAAVETDHRVLSADHDRIGRLEQRVDDIHEDLVGIRNDLRAFASGRPLPTLTPEPPK